MDISVSLNGDNFEQVIYAKEDAFEQLVAQNAQTIFGDKAIYIDAKKKMDTSFLGGAIPDGFLIDLSDQNDPQFYIVEVELQKHSFRHILEQINKFITSCRNSSHQQTLIGKLYEISELREIIHNLISPRETYKFLKDTIARNQKILIIIDGLKPEIEEQKKYHTEWEAMVKVQTIKHFKQGENNILIVDPPFENLWPGNTSFPSPEKKVGKDSQYTEEFHLDGCEANVRDTYNKLKSEFLSVKSTLRFNPVKYYVGVRDIKNIAAIRFRKRKLLVEFDLSEDEVNKTMKTKHHHKIRLCSSKGPMVEIDDMSHWDEIQKLISKVMEKHQET